MDVLAGLLNTLKRQLFDDDEASHCFSFLHGMTNQYLLQFPFLFLLLTV